MSGGRMRYVRVAVLGGLVLKAFVLGAWWFDVAGLAYASKEQGGAKTEAAGVDASPVSAEALARSRGLRAVLEGVRQRGAELEHREQVVAAREAALKTLEKTIAEQVAHLEGLHRPAP